MTYQLIREQKDGLEAELAVAEVEEVFEGRAEEVEDHSVVVAFGSEPSNERDPNTASESLVHLGLIFELRMFGFDALELDGNFFARDDVDSKVNITCWAASGQRASNEDKNWRQRTNQRSRSRSSSPSGTCHRLGDPYGCLSMIRPWWANVKGGKGLCGVGEGERRRQVRSEPFCTIYKTFDGSIKGRDADGQCGSSEVNSLQGVAALGRSVPVRTRTESRFPRVERCRQSR